MAHGEDNNNKRWWRRRCRFPWCARAIQVAPETDRKFCVDAREVGEKTATTIKTELYSSGINILILCEWYSFSSPSYRRTWVMAGRGSVRDIRNSVCPAIGLGNIVMFFLYNKCAQWQMRPYKVKGISFDLIWCGRSVSHFLTLMIMPFDSHRLTVCVCFALARRLSVTHTHTQLMLTPSALAPSRWCPSINYPDECAILIFTFSGNINFIVTRQRWRLAKYTHRNPFHSFYHIGNNVINKFSRFYARPCCVYGQKAPLVLYRIIHVLMKFQHFKTNA